MENKAGEIIQLEAKKKGLSLTDLAKATGIPKATVHSWSTGRAPSIAHVKQVSETLKLPFHYLAFGEQDPHQKNSGEQISLTELFSGDIRLTIKKINKKENL